MVNRKLGFCEISLYFFTLVLVWGWRGNCYGERRILRIDLGMVTQFSWVSSNGTTTTIYWRWYMTEAQRAFDRKWHNGEIDWCWWTSEHIALRWGEHYDSNVEIGQPDFCQYVGWLGTHVYV